MTKTISLTTIIIIDPHWFEAINLLPQCLESLEWCNHKMIVSSEITSELKSIADKYAAKIILQVGQNFAEWRTNAVLNVKTHWILFVDADEQVTPELKSEIQQVLSQGSKVAGYAIPRLNYIFNCPMKHAGWWPDYVLRLIDVTSFQGYQGAVHEQPILQGEVSHLQSHFNHYKHPDLEGMVTKTCKWSDTEAQLLHTAHHPPMFQYRFVRPFVSEVITRLFVKQGFLDLTEGLMDAIYQSYSRFITYAKLWELQQKHS